MKQLTIIGLIIFSVFARAYAGDCNVTLRAKTKTSKGAKLDGVSFSAKQISALKTVCNVDVQLMGKEELIKDYIAGLERKEAKELADKNK